MNVKSSHNRTAALEATLSEQVTENSDRESITITESDIDEVHKRRCQLSASDVCARAQCSGSSLREACRKAEARGEIFVEIKGCKFEFKKLSSGKRLFREVKS